MRTYLTCSYEQRHAVKSAGARWDVHRRQWFYDGAPLPAALAPFASAANTPAPRPRAGVRSVCRACGQTGIGPGYPFSNYPDGLCDDCA